MAKSTRLSLGKKLDIAAADELKQRLEATLVKAPQVVLVADKVERADTAGLQLILAFMRKAQSQAIEVKWFRPSDAVKEAAERLGLLAKLAID